MNNLFMNFPKPEDIILAASRIRGRAHTTPVLTSTGIDKIAGATLFFKCENFQKAGAFKFRGACNSVFSLSAEEASKGVATHSSGNHAGALALAAAMRNIKAHIVMPENAKRVKVDAVRAYGADITFCKPTLADRESTLANVQKETGAVFVHPYDNFNVIAGQATAARELIHSIPALDYIITPVGGGGLLSGTALSAAYFSSGVTVLGAEPEGADDAYRSLRDGVKYPSVNPDTIADGLLTSLGDMPFAILSDYNIHVLTVSDSEIIAAMKLMLQRLKIVVEPSAAVTLAAIIKHKKFFALRKVGVILSGGNIDWNSFLTESK